MNCPDCGAVLDLGRIWLDEVEHVETMDCPECSFAIETMSNLAHRDWLEGSA